MTSPEILTTASAPADLPELLAAATAADGVPPLSDGLLEAVATGAALWEMRAQGALLGFGVCAVQGERGAAEAVVHPQHRGTGLGAALIEGMHAELLATGAPAWFWSHGDHPAAAALAARLGYRRERELLQLTTDPLAGSPLPELPAQRAHDEGDVEIRDFRTGDEPEWLRINNAAFDWHPEQGRQALEDLQAFVQDPGFTPRHILIAERAGRMIGFHQLKLHAAHPSGLRMGEVYVIAVDPAVHAAGVGRLLTIAGMHRLAELGAEAIELYVESDNVPARALYESLGFRNTIMHVSYAPPITAQES